METTDQYNFNLFRPRNLHGRKNRNVILSMLVIWAVAVFGFQFLLRGIEKPTTEKALTVFESIWPSASTKEINTIDYKALLNSLILVRGKNTLKSDEQKILGEAISSITFNVIPDSTRSEVLGKLSEINAMRSAIAKARSQEYIVIRSSLLDKTKSISAITGPYTGIRAGSLEERIFSASLSETYPESLSDVSLSRLPEIMKLYLTHNQSVLTDTIFLGFPFHYFYTAVFLLILFIGLCIVYNLLIEWRLKKQGVVE